MRSEKEKVPGADAVLFAVGEAFKEVLLYGLSELSHGAIQELNGAMSQGKGHIRFIVETEPVRVLCELVPIESGVAPVTLFGIVGKVPSTLLN